MPHKSRTIRPTSLAASVAPEDLQRGDYVAVAAEIHELPSFFWCCDAPGISPEDVVRIQTLPSEAGVPLRIKAICLPFVFVKTPAGDAQPLDVRQVHFVRLRRHYARTAWKALRKQKPKSKRHASC